jgi:hypothetical protein
MGEYLQGNWKPTWKEGINDNIRSFIMKLLDPLNYNRNEMSSFLNHPYAL